MTQGEGQAKVPTTRFLLTPSPYLQEPDSDHAADKKPSKPRVGPLRVRGVGGREERRRGKALTFSGDQLPALNFVSLPFYLIPDLNITIVSEAKVVEGPDLPGYTDGYLKSTAWDVWDHGWRGMGWSEDRKS